MDTSPTGTPDQLPLIVLLHGIFFDRSLWRPVIDRLDGRFEVLALDLPGHGSRHRERFEFDEAVASIEERVGGLDVRILVGFSLGGYVAMGIAARNPRVARALLIADASREPRAFLRGPLRWLWRVAGLVPDPVARPIARLVIRAGTPPAVRRVLLRSRLSVSGGFRALASLPADGFCSRVSRFPGPAWFFNGARDPVAHPGERAFLAAAASGRLQVVPGVGHHAPVQAPDRFVACLEQLARLQWPPSAMGGGSP